MEVSIDAPPSKLYRRRYPLFLFLFIQCSILRDGILMAVEPFVLEGKEVYLLDSHSPRGWKQGEAYNTAAFSAHGHTLLFLHEQTEVLSGL